MNQTQTAKAIGRYLRIAPRKARLVADTLKGLSLNEAEARLITSPHRASVFLLKLLRSAAANAKHNAKLEASKLYIKDIRVDQGPKLKRWMPRARGGASPIEKKTSHITLVLGVSEKIKAPKFTLIAKPAKRKEAKPAAQDKTKEVKPKIVSETKPAVQSNFFQRIFRRKAI
jgi:large subunit ribosomal protein L22